MNRRELIITLAKQLVSTNAHATKCEQLCNCQRALRSDCESFGCGAAQHFATNAIAAELLRAAGTT